MISVPEIFGSMVFGLSEMKARLNHSEYSSLEKTIKDGTPLEPRVADAVAKAMKDWAVAKGATHFSHWFQPMTGITAEKHDSFISPHPDGSVSMEFSGRSLITSEPDASSFPSGGLRATFEARGYTAWDPTSFAFIKDGTLCIPTAFCSYDGDALDKKTPLLRSMNAVNTQALRVLRLFGREVRRVSPTAGAEQEYFLISRENFNARRDLVYTGRTLFGARPPKSQQLDDHYSGHIRMHAAAFMKELDEELWKLGILAKTEHNEAAPAQHELAPIFTVANVSCDQNQLVMETMRKVAKRQGLACLLHEKPFEGINGSGKHVNWSLMTDSGESLFDPGTTPEANAQFLLFLCAVIKAVDDYQDLLRISVATSTNDRRLGANEAPPAVVSIFIGDELEAILDSIEKDVAYDKRERGVIQVGVDTLPSFPRDATDRNRTSPFAFTSNRFEFRMPGSSLSISGPNTVINTIVAESLRVFADELEGAADLPKALNALIRRTISEHRRIIFNGNGYDEAWVREAERRGLSNYRTAAEAIPHMLDRKNVELFKRHGIYTEREIASRCQIQLGTYCRTLGIEAGTMLEMTRKDILPAVFRCAKTLADGVAAKKAAGVSAKGESSLLERISALSDSLAEKADGLEELIKQTRDMEPPELSVFYSRTVIPAMDGLRADADELEKLTDGNEWPFPTYGTLLYRI